MSHYFPSRVIFSSCLCPVGGSLCTWFHMKRKGNLPRVGIWLRQDFGHSIVLIGTVKKNLVCESMCLCEYGPYLKRENTSRINVRLQYAWRELRGNLKSCSAPHIKAKVRSRQPMMTICLCRRMFRCKLHDPPRRNQIRAIFHMNQNKGSSSNLICSHEKELWRRSFVERSD